MLVIAAYRMPLAVIAGKRETERTPDWRPHSICCDDMPALKESHTIDFDDHGVAPVRTCTCESRAFKQTRALILRVPHQRVIELDACRDFGEAPFTARQRQRHHASGR